MESDQPRRGVLKFLSETILETLKRNLVLTMTLGGAFLVLLGGIFGTSIDQWALAPKGTGDSILKVGSAILGGGVFAAIMKGQQFNDFFMKNIASVHYTPQEVLSTEVLRERWKVLTGSILKSTLPETYNSATDEIANQFLGNELKYHFEGLELRYEMRLLDDRHTLEVTQTNEVKVVISPNQSDVILEQKIQVDGACELQTLLVNGEPVALEERLVDDPDDSSKRLFRLNLLDFPLRFNSDGDRYITLQRTYKMTQDILEDPNIILDLIRYTKGLKVKVKMHGHGRFSFKETGTSTFTTPEPFDCAEGWRWYTLASEDQLLLPGQGFILTVISG